MLSHCIHITVGITPQFLETYSCMQTICLANIILTPSSLSALLPPLQYKETNTLITTILEVQPRSSSGGEGKSNDEIVQELVASIRTRVPGNKYFLASARNGSLRNKLRELNRKQVLRLNFFISFSFPRELASHGVLHFCLEIDCTLISHQQGPGEATQLTARLCSELKSLGLCHPRQ